MILANTDQEMNEGLSRSILTSDYQLGAIELGFDAVRKVGILAKGYSSFEMSCRARSNSISVSRYPTLISASRLTRIFPSIGDEVQNLAFSNNVRRRRPLYRKLLDAMERGV